MPGLRDVSLDRRAAVVEERNLCRFPCFPKTQVYEFIRERAFVRSVAVGYWLVCVIYRVVELSVSFECPQFQQLLICFAAELRLSRGAEHFARHSLNLLGQ